MKALCQQRERHCGNRRWLSLCGAAPQAEANPDDLIPCLGFLQLHPLLVEMPNEALAIGGECVFAGDHIGAVASDPPPVHAKGGIWGCETMARNNPGSLPGNIHSEIPSCFDTNSLMVDQSKGKKRAWPPTVALASGQFQQKLGECLYAGQCGWQLGQLVQLPVL